MNFGQSPGLTLYRELARNGANARGEPQVEWLRASRVDDESDLNSDSRFDTYSLIVSYND